MSIRRPEPSTADYALLLAVVVMVVFGLLMIYSATFTWPTSSRYMTRQTAAAVLGFAALAVLSRMDYRLWRRLALPIMGLAVVLLALVLIVGEGSAASWFSAGSFQPSEFAKLAFVVYVAAWLASKGDKIRDVTYGLVPFSVLLGIVTGLILLEPDLGTSILVVATAVAMFFVAGAELSQMLIGGVAGGAALYVFIANSSYVKERLEIFFNRSSDPLHTHHHIRCVLTALRAGGLFGRGLGNGELKFILPLPHTDSMFPVIGEELGLIGCVAVVAVFVFIAYRGMSISFHAPDRFSSLLAFGLTCWISFQAVVHVAGNTGTLPYTGITLPFVSYGGSSLTACLAAVGILLAISRFQIQKELPTHKTLGSGRRDRWPRLSYSRRRGRMEKRPDR